jgi:hypothetical protein
MELNNTLQVKFTDSRMKRQMMPNAKIAINLYHDFFTFLQSSPQVR